MAIKSRAIPQNRKTQILYLGLLLMAISLTVIVAGEAWATDSKGTEVAEETKPDPNTATIIGVVKYEGDAPFRRAVNFGAELQCKKMHEGKVYYEDVIVNKNGTLKETLVYIKGKVKGDYKPPTKPIVLDQKGCIFVPHVVGAMIGQPIEFLNSDPVLHNVRTVSTKENPLKEKTFNISQPMQGMKYAHTFTKSDIGIPIRCDVHFWMSGFIHILSHPFFAVTDEKGTFKIQGLPPRTYNLEAWHGKLGAKKQKVTVAAGKTTTVEFVFKEE